MKDFLQNRLTSLSPLTIKAGVMRSIAVMPVVFINRQQLSKSAKVSATKVKRLVARGTLAGDAADGKGAPLFLQIRLPSLIAQINAIKS